MRRRAALAMALLALGSATLAGAETVRQGDLLITVHTQIKPYKLPRTQTAPVAVLVSGALKDVHGGVPPQLQAMRVEVNRHGALRSRGLAVCPVARLAGTSSAKALELCGAALIGSGQFWAHIVLPDQGAYPTRGQILVFNGRSDGRPTLLAHIFTANPFDSAFTVVFTIRHVERGRYGTELYASLPEALGSWGYVDRIKLTLKREYRFEGRKLSYLNASCPAEAGVTRVPFQLAHVTLYFDTTRISADVAKSCGVRE